VLSVIPKSVQWLLGGIIAVALAFGLWLWTTSMGRDRLVDVARAKGLCSSMECAEGILQVSTLIGAQHNMWPSTVQWCVGVDRWAGTRARKVEWLKAIVVSGMYLPCGDMSGAK
jgi:hypothetical protein